MFVMLGVFDFFLITWIVAGVAFVRWLLSDAEGRTKRIEAKLDRILEHLDLDDDEPPP